MITLIVTTLMLITAIIRPETDVNIELDDLVFLDMVIVILAAMHYGVI
jgi:hypothetical protein